MGKKMTHKLVIQLVPGTRNFKTPPQPVTPHSRVAHEVQNLVADHLIGKAQPFRIKGTILIENHCVIETAAQRQAILLQPFDIFHESESPCAGDRRSKILNRRIKAEILPSDPGMIELNGIINTQPVVRVCGNALSIPAEHQWPDNLCHLPGDIKSYSDRKSVV